MKAIVESEQAILGGEVWDVKDGTIWGAIPVANDKIPALWHWETFPQDNKESWKEYCRRTAEESIRAVKSMRVEEEVSPEFREFIYFNITYVDQEDLDSY